MQGDDADKAITYALLAGDRAEEVFAHQEAERHYRTALEFSNDIEGPETLKAQALEKLGAVLKTSSRYAEGRSALSHAARIYHTAGDLESQLRAEAQIGAIDGLVGAPDEGISRLEPFVEMLERQPPSLSLDMLYVVLVRFYNVLAGREISSRRAKDWWNWRVICRKSVYWLKQKCMRCSLIYTGQVARRSCAGSCYRGC